MNRTIYLDNHTTGRPSDAAISKMIPFLTHHWGNPIVPHNKGQELIAPLIDSYKTIYHSLGAKENNLFLFTSSGSEAVNHIIHSTYKDVTLHTGKNHFVTASIDEAPAILTIESLEKFHCVAKTIPADIEGKITAKAVAEALSPRTALVSLSWANGLTGVINPVAEIGDLCRQRNIYFHLEATHILGKLYYEFEDTGADFLSFNGDQLHGTRGSGGILIREGVKISPFIIGGAEQAGLRGGPFNTPAFVALSCALKELIEAREYVCTEIARLRNKLEAGIKNEYEEAIILFQEQDRLPNCTAIAFPGIANEALLFALNRKGVCASIGGGIFQQIAYILLSCGIKPEIANSAISFSLSRYTTEDEVDRAIKIIADCGKKLRKISKNLHGEHR